MWQLRWTQQELSITGDEKVEALFSVSADGRISKWFVFNNGLDCIGICSEQPAKVLHLSIQFSEHSDKDIKSIHKNQSQLGTSAVEPCLDKFKGQGNKNFVNMSHWIYLF